MNLEGTRQLDEILGDCLIEGETLFNDKRKMALYVAFRYCREVESRYLIFLQKLESQTFGIRSTLSRQDKEEIAKNMCEMVVNLNAVCKSNINQLDVNIEYLKSKSA